MSPLLIKVVLVVAGLVVGGGVTFGVVKLTGNTTESGDTTTTTTTAKTTTTKSDTTTEKTTTTMVTSTEATNTTGSRAVDTLKFVVVISRHGNRGGSKDYTNDPYPLSNTTYWPYGMNALTSHGRLQSYNLGAKLRSLYNGFLPSIFDTDEFYVTSDSVQRDIYSAECVVTGLYPPYGWQKWSDDVAWMPISVSTDSPDNSVGVNQCQKYTTEKTTSYNSFYASYEANITYMIDYFKSATGTTYSMKELADVYDKIICTDTEGYVLPDWIQEVYPEPFSTLYGDYYLAVTAGTDEIVRIYAGELYDDIVSYMKKVVAGSTSKLMLYYSGHDSTILNMQVAYGVNRTSVEKNVKVGSGLIMEMHQDPLNSSDYYIKVLLIDGSSSDLEPTALPLAACGDPCYYDSFINVTYSTYGGVDLTTECSS